MNRLFDDLWRRPQYRSDVPGEWFPAMDVVETEDEFRLVAELPGIKKEAVKVSFTENVVTIRGEKKAEMREEKENWHQVERSYGVFERSIRLPVPVDSDKVKARFEDGVLTVLLPKAAEARSREINIES
jgi:HSP20 family protein